MVYNKDLMKAAGYGEFPKTWQDLRAASLAVRRKTGKTGFGFPAHSCGTPAIWFFLNFYWWSKGWALIDKGPDGKFFTEQIKLAWTWGPYGLGPVAIPFMWNAVGRAAGSLFIGEKSAKDAASELREAIAKELAKNQR